MIYIEELTETQKTNLDTLHHSQLKKFHSDEHLLEMLHDINAINDFLRNEYMSREKIPLQKTFEENYIEIKSDSTSFVRISRDQFTSEKEFLDTLKNLKQVAKKNDCKLIGANKLSKWFKENFEQYEMESIKFSEMFNQLKNDWADYELRIGISDDTYYNNHLQANYFEMVKMQYRDTMLSQVNVTYKKMIKIIGELESGTKYIKITI